MAGDNSINLVLLGPPGSGKGTQAKLLSTRYHLSHISTGDLFRQEVARGSELGKQAKSFMERGELIPDLLVNALLSEQIKKDGSKKGFIFDGYPRNINQAHDLDNILKQNAKTLNWVFYFKTSAAVIIQRLSGRRVCVKCGANYHLVNMPPTQDGICDECGGKLIQRKDDSEETIRKRIEVYEKETKGLVDYYQRQGNLKILSGDLNSEEVFKEIARIPK